MAESQTDATTAAHRDSHGVNPNKPLLRNRKYLFLMVAQAISNLGDWLYILALFVIVGFKWHGSPMVISLMMLCLSGPMVLLGPLTGLLADKWNRTIIMMVSNIIMALLVGVIPWLPEKWMLFAVLILVGVFQSLFNPAESGKLKEIVPDKHMQQAASINQSIVQLTKIIGPGASGFLVAVLGSMSAFWLDSISFILSTLLLIFTGFRAAVLVSSVTDQAPVQNGDSGTHLLTNPQSTITEVPSAEKPANAEESTKVAAAEKMTSRRRFLEGFTYIRKVRILWAGTVILTLAIFFIQMTDAQIVTLLRVIPNATSSLLGLIMGLSGAGGLVAALLLGVIKWKSAIRLMGLGCIGIGVALTGVAFIARYGRVAGGISTPLMIVIVALSVLIGLFAGLSFIPFQAEAQKSTPVELTGRVFGVIGSLTTGAALLGPALGGVIVTWFGVISAYIGTGVSVLLVGIITITARPFLEKSASNFGIETGT